MLLAILLITSCSSDDGNVKDEEKPTITISYSGGFPQACESLKRGETYVFKALVSDNSTLASYSLDLHHNFDHHTHDDQEAICDLEPVKAAVNPFIYMENFRIDGNRKEYEINIEVTIPQDIDAGDYHCAYSVTDETGWQSRTSIDIKIIE
ncbi:DUF4625 domain-containing protein [Maribacter cobaltidurans]|uniref:DUF4625 domain-containing protein n=1 Tax=Maribacter cobaltidurans TaxID=1178778 RepID=UPI001E4FAEDF|nr:DUF4625 domain-containing protein [Maribacter cobaltidurans]